MWCGALGTGILICGFPLSAVSLESISIFYTFSQKCNAIFFKRKVYNDHHHGVALLVWPDFLDRHHGSDALSFSWHKYKAPTPEEEKKKGEIDSLVQVVLEVTFSIPKQCFHSWLTFRSHHAFPFVWSMWTRSRKEFERIVQAFVLAWLSIPLKEYRITSKGESVRVRFMRRRK